MSFLKHSKASAEGDTSAKQPSRLSEALERHSSRRGACSAGLTALAVAAVVLFNLLVAQLPDSVTQFDMTNTGIYNITQTSVDYLANVTDDVVIHVLADESQVDSRIVRFLSKYEDLSDHLTVEYVNPTVYPSVLTKYNADSNTIVVTCEATGRQETIAIDDIIGYDMMSYYYSGEATETEFDAEGLLTSAVDGVLSDASRTVYQTSGHDEVSIPSAITDRLKKLHITVESVNLLTDGGIPDDCDLLILNAPSRDLADDERTAVEAYLAAGGQVMYNMAGQDLDLPNLEQLCASYGMVVADGMIADTQRYYQNNPYLFFPTVDNSVDAADGLGSDAMILCYASRGMTIGTPARDTITVSSFLNTSNGGTAVVDEGNQTTGVFSVGAVATEEIDDGITARFTVVGSNSLIAENLLTAFTNLDNADLFIQAATCGFDEVSAISIEPVSLSEPTNTVTTGGVWALLFIFVLPVMLLIAGFVRWMRRRKL